MYIRQGQTDQEAELRAYFARPPQPDSLVLGILLMGLGALVLIVAFKSREDFSFPMLLLFSFMLGGAGGFLYFRTQQANDRKQKEFEKLPPSPTDSQVQAWLEKGLGKLKEHSRLALHLDEAESSLSEPLLIQNPSLRPVGGVDPTDLTWRVGQDRILRFGVYRVNLIWLTDRHLASYSCFYDFIRDVAVNEVASEIHYCDVVSFSTRETSSTSDYYSINLPTGQKATVQQDLILSVASGEAIQLTLEDAYVRQMTGVEKLPESGGERAEKAIRAMLRDKKRREAQSRLQSAA